MIGKTTSKKNIFHHLKTNEAPEACNIYLSAYEMFGTSTPAEVFGMGKLASPAKEPCGNTGGEGGVSALGGGEGYGGY